MKTFCIQYKTKKNESLEFWVNADSNSDAKAQFRIAMDNGDVDEGSIISKVTERE